MADLITGEYLRCVCYVYPTEEDAKASEQSGGSGFLIRVPLGGNSAAWAHYVVTNDHVLKNGTRYFTNPAIRLNVMDRAETLPTNISRWVKWREADIAVLPFDPDESLLSETTFIEPQEFVTKLMFSRENVFRFGVGDDVFMVGRLVGHDGTERNHPSIRTGMLSVLPCAASHDEFLIECRSIGGYIAVLRYSSALAGPLGVAKR